MLLRRMAAAGTHSEGRSTSVMPQSSFRKARDDVAAVSCACKQRPSALSESSYGQHIACSRLHGGHDGAGVGQQERAGLNLQVQLHRNIIESISNGASVRGAPVRTLRPVSVEKATKASRTGAPMTASSVPCAPDKRELIAIRKHAHPAPQARAFS